MNSFETKELNELILMIRERSDAAFSELVARYTPMMNKVISGFSMSGILRSEAFSEACVALHRAALSFDLDREGVTFGLYARICVNHRICDLIARQSRELPLADVDIDSVGIAFNVESRIEGRERMDRYLEVARKILSEYEYNVFILYINGETNGEIAAALGKDLKSVENAKSRIIKRLRDESEIFSDI